MDRELKNLVRILRAINPPGDIEQYVIKVSEELQDRVKDLEDSYIKSEILRCKTLKKLTGNEICIFHKIGLIVDVPDRDYTEGCIFDLSNITLGNLLVLGDMMFENEPYQHFKNRTIRRYNKDRGDRNG